MVARERDGAGVAGGFALSAEQASARVELQPLPVVVEADGARGADGDALPALSLAFRRRQASAGRQIARATQAAGRPDTAWCDALVFPLANSTSNIMGS